LPLGLDLRLERLSHIEREALDNLIDLIRVPISINQVAVVEWDWVIPILNQGCCLAHPLSETRDKPLGDCARLHRP
jgi:hypothetical protein